MTTVAASDALATYAAQLTSIDAGDVSTDAAGLRVADAIAAFVAGRATADGRRVARASGTHVVSPNDPVAFAATIRHTEIDDIHLETCTTIGAIVIPAALAAAAGVRIDGMTLRRGIAAGYATAIRFGRAIGGANVLREGIWPSLAVAPVTAAAVTGVMQQLDADVLANALRIALLRSVARVGHATENTARWYIFGSAVRDGIEAAKAAAAGLRVDELAPFPFKIAAAEGDAAIADRAMTQVSQKPFCTARQALSGVEAFIRLLESGIRPGSIASVRVSVPRAYAWMIENDARPGDRLSSIVSQRFQIAAAAMARGVLYDIERGGQFAPDIIAFAQRVTVEPTDAFDATYPRRWPARVTIALGDGSERTCTVEEPLGDPSSPLTFTDLQRKSPAYSAALHQHCLLAPDTGPSELLAALAALPEGS